jgi:hypothetical protein
VPRASIGTIPYGRALPAIAKHENESRKCSSWEAYTAQARRRTILGLVDGVRTLLEGRRTSGAAVVEAAKVRQDVEMV